MTITLADINDTLQEQTDAITEEQIETQERIAELSDSFDTFVTMLMILRLNVKQTDKIMLLKHWKAEAPAEAAATD